MALIFMFKKFIYIISLILFLNAQDYKISAPQITGSQSYSTSDVYNLISGVNGQPTGLGNSDSLYCLLYTSPSPRDRTRSRMPSSA